MQLVFAALALAVVAAVALDPTDTGVVQHEEVHAQVPSVIALDDQLKVQADGKVCAKRMRTRRCKAYEQRNVLHCPEEAGFNYTVQPPCFAEEPCIKHDVTCSSVKVGTSDQCIEQNDVRTCPQQCEDGQLCNVARVCKTHGGITACEWAKNCTITSCEPTLCNVTRECVRYTVKDTFVHRCNEGECIQQGEKVRTCKTVPVCKVPEITTSVRTCAKWGRWKTKCTAWFPARISVLKQQYAEAQQSTSAAFATLQASAHYIERQHLRQELAAATAAMKASPEYAAYEVKEKYLRCVHSELACRYFGDWDQRRDHCRAWKACAPCPYAKFACSTATQGTWKKKQCRKSRRCKNFEKVNAKLHVVLETPNK